MRIYSSDINAYAREHRVSYQEAWRALESEGINKLTEKETSITKFTMKEEVNIIGMGETSGVITNIVIRNSMQNPQYTVVLNESGRVMNFSENDLIKKGK